MYLSMENGNNHCLLKIFRHPFTKYILIPSLKNYLNDEYHIKCI